jgi:chondroitin synthase
MLSIFLSNSDKFILDSYQSYLGLKKYESEINLPLVSVIITTYNSSSTIEACVESIIKQSYKNLEIIIVDDASTDQTVEIINKFKDSRIKLYRLDYNSGTYLAKNIGISKSKGEIIVFQDSDDYSHHERIMVQTLPLIENKDLFVTRTKYLRFNRNNGEIITQDGDISRYTFITNVVRREVFDKIGYFDAVRRAGDEEWYERLITFLGIKSVKLLDVTLYKAEFNSKNLTSDSFYIEENGSGHWKISKDRQDYIKLAQNRYKNSQQWFIENFPAYPIINVSEYPESIKVNNLQKPVIFSNHFDYATQIMLSNSGLLDLTNVEKESLINHYKNITKEKSKPAEVKVVKTVPKDWPKDLKLPDLPESSNDFLWYENRKSILGKTTTCDKPLLSVIIPTFNRARILDITLACLYNQKTDYKFEVVVVDDGSKEDIFSVIKSYENKLEIYYIRQKDEGYRVGEARNIGMRAAKGTHIALLDCDMAPNINWVQSYMTKLIKNDDLILIGPRKYIDTESYKGEDFLNNLELLSSLPEVCTNNNVADKRLGDISIDWRLNHFQKTDDLRLSNDPYRFFASGNVAFSKKCLSYSGYFDEDFKQWGGEDNEFAYRLYRSGFFFQTAWDALAYHQEPPGKENETNRAEGAKQTKSMMLDRIPHLNRKIESIENVKIYKAPLVSIYVPAYNCSDSIEKCIDSALNQTVTDLEVVICNDGSTDNTWEILQKYANNPRVKLVNKENGGIGTASNAAIKNSRGFYIGQLDSDDYLNPDAVELCLKEFLKNRNLVCVYTSYQNLNIDNTITPGYNWPVFSREKNTTGMIVHSFRMFTVRSWHIVGGHNERLLNAVDYDFYTKLSEIGPIHHINSICYNRKLHGENTSIKNVAAQTINTFKVINSSLQRQGIKNYRYESINLDDPNCRLGKWVKKD